MTVYANIPLRLRILRALSETIKAVTIANGYEVDLSDMSDGTKRVIRGRLTIGDDDPSTLVSILEPPSSVEAIQNKGPDNTIRLGEWDILIQGWIKNDRDNDDCDPAYILAASVQKALTAEMARTVNGRPSGDPNLFGMGKTVLHMKIGAPVVRPTEEVTGYGVFYIILTLKISEDMAKPFG